MNAIKHPAQLKLGHVYRLHFAAGFSRVAQFVCREGDDLIAAFHRDGVPSHEQYMRFDADQLQAAEEIEPKICPTRMLERQTYLVHLRSGHMVRGKLIGAGSAAGGLCAVFEFAPGRTCRVPLGWIFKVWRQ